MKIIIPMAGRGTRLRPHTLTVPKPLVKVAGKSIVRRLVEDLAAAYGGEIEEIAFITGDFGEEVNQDLIELATSLGAKGMVFQQSEKLGTAHAILCAKECLDGPVIVAFADTLFDSDFELDIEQDGVLWVQKVADPSAYGVVTLDEDGFVTEFVEKPESFVSDLAIIGIYYFKDGAFLRQELQYLIDNNIMQKGEYQITNALENMKAKGKKFRTQAIDEWLDCGNKKAVVYANQRILSIKNGADCIDESIQLENSVIIPPCCIAENVVLKNAVVGPHVSIGANSKIEDAVVINSVIQDHVHLTNVVLEDSMLGSHANCKGKKADLSLSDYSTFEL